MQPTIQVVNLAEDLLPLCGSISTSGDKKTNQVLGKDLNNGGWAEIWDDPNAAEPAKK